MMVEHSDRCRECKRPMLSVDGDPEPICWLCAHELLKRTSPAKLRVGRWLGCDQVHPDVRWHDLALFALIRLVSAMLNGPKG